MRISLTWLRELVPLGASPSEAAEALASRGLPVDAVYETAGHTVFDVDVPANRPDCLGHIGVARELAAAFGLELRPRPAPAPSSGEPIERDLTVRVEEEELCRRYTARLVRGVRVAPSPAWVVSRLEACGLRPVNNVVDASNLVLLELGHPIHTFDLDRLDRRTIVVRRARPGERLRTLDGVERSLDPSVLVIADASRAVAIAGVMGGADSEIRATTRDVVIEAAWFEPRQIRRAARRLGISTEASQRFERGADPEAVIEAQETAARLLRDLAGGCPAPGILDLRPRPFERRPLRLRLGRVRALLGFDPGPDAVVKALEALGLEPSRDGDVVGTVVPSWRVDIEREEDLVEEVARQVGYGQVPSRPPPALSPATGDAASAAAAERARDLLADLGFHEAFCYAMIGPGQDDPFVSRSCPEPVAVSNPLSEALARLRRSLAPGLLAAVASNLRRGIRDVRLFEVGRVFLGGGAGAFPSERSHVGLAWTGAAEAPHWSRRAREADLYDMAGVVERLVGSLKPGLALERRPGALPGLHPSKAIEWVLQDGAAVGWSGQLHPDAQRAADFPTGVLLAEVDLDVLARAPSVPARYRPLSRLPGVSRDLSFVLTRGTPWSRLLEALARVSAPESPARFELVDVYQGEPLSPSEVSYSVRFVLEPMSRTLTDEEIEAYRLALVRAAERGAGARLRSDRDNELTHGRGDR